MGDRIVYVVESGSYSDYSVDGLYDNREAAEEHARLMNEQRPFNEAYVSEWPLNSRSPQVIHTYTMTCIVSANGEVVNENSLDFTSLEHIEDDQSEHIVDLDTVADLGVGIRIHPPTVNILKITGKRHPHQNGYQVQIQGRDQQAVQQSYSDNVARIRADELGLT